MFLDIRRCIEEEKLGFGHVYLHARGFTEEVDDGSETQIFSSGINSHEKNLVHELTMGYRGGDAMGGEARERMISDGHLDSTTQSFYHKDEKEGREWVTLPHSS